jgi:hypothetical protein
LEVKGLAPLLYISIGLGLIAYSLICVAITVKIESYVLTIPFIPACIKILFTRYFSVKT